MLARADLFGMWRRWGVFLLGGGLNTVATYLVYLAFSVFLNYQAAYLVSFVAGIFFSYVFNSLFVFKVRVSFRGALRYPVVYLVQYGVGALLMYFFVELMAVPEKVAPILVPLITLPLTYLLARTVLLGKISGRSGGSGSV